MAKILLCYIPVLHAGYLNWFERHREAKAVYVLSEEVLVEFAHLKKDLRALKPDQACRMINSLGVCPKAEVIGPMDLADISTVGDIVVMPDEEECHAVAERWLKHGLVEIQFDPVFLRYDRKKATAENAVDEDWTVTEDEFHRVMMGRAAEEAAKSPDWWRQVGGILVRDGQVLLTAYNHTVPTKREALFYGDPRSLFSAGLEIEASLVLHAEAAIVAEAARRADLSLEGASLYITTFPCAPCAKQVAYSGIKRIYFRDGYSRTDGQEVLRAKGVAIIRVDIERPRR
ncbi:MAG: hypothetical protein HY220_00155 [Candidatus Sungbacteria bacterium]|uniref:CMP/dCMP-type deaminase domain-containing protein n=1 Tax=Candidatus Sungiibacteriota bacterium TaxID=2750080 RepID=A0A9D6LQW2_9BACT|nr:hypothetical protein [Candidatus Sungbacteria bacterium]